MLISSEVFLSEIDLFWQVQMLISSRVCPSVIGLFGFSVSLGVRG